MNKKILFFCLVCFVCFLPFCFSQIMNGTSVNSDSNICGVKGITSVNDVNLESGVSYIDVYMRNDDSGNRNLVYICDTDVYVNSSYVYVGSIEAGTSISYKSISSGNFYTDYVAIDSGDGTVSGETQEGGECNSDYKYINITSTGDTDLYIFVNIYYDS